MPTRLPEYIIHAVDAPPEMTGLWNGPAWQHVHPLDIASFRPEGSSHHPVTQCKLQHSVEGLSGIFQVKDRFVRCVNTEFQSEVYLDSCVEIFLQPKSGAGYFNFEFNCGGALLAYHVIDPGRANGKFKDYVVLSDRVDSQIKRFHTLSATVNPEVIEPLDWYLEFFIPYSVMESYVGPIDRQATWRGNLFKCGDETSHPHWGAWSAVDELNFHRPDNFGFLHFSG